MVDVQCSAVRACCQCRSFYYVMRTTFRLSGVALSSFWMCHVAFGNRCALVYTAPLNKRATDASALPIANTALVYAGDPLCRLRGFKLLNDSFFFIRDIPARHIGDLGGEVPFAYCTHPPGDSERPEYLYLLFHTRAKSNPIHH